MERTAVGVLVIVALVTSCSNAGSTVTSTADEELPVVTGITQQFVITWQPADDFEQLEALAGSELINEGASVLVPAGVPPGSSESVGRLSIQKTFPTDLVYVHVRVSFQQNRQETALSLGSSAPDGTPACAERVSGEAAGGLSGWVATEVRTVSGCTATNEAGLTFVEWEEGANRYHVETRMEPNDALSWLTSWRLLP
jgi:hypothetical protein